MQDRRRRVAQVDIGGRRTGTNTEIVGALGLRLEIEPGAEGAASARQDYDPHRRIFVGPHQRLGELLQHRPRDGVHALRRVQRDRRDTVFDAVDQGFQCGQGHVFSGFVVERCQAAQGVFLAVCDQAWLGCWPAQRGRQAGAHQVDEVVGVKTLPGCAAAGLQRLVESLQRVAAAFDMRIV